MSLTLERAVLSSIWNIPKVKNQGGNRERGGGGGESRDEGGGKERMEGMLAALPSAIPRSPVSSPV